MRLTDFCNTPRQREIVRLYEEMGENAAAVARELKTDPGYVRRVVRAAKKEAADAGHAPGHWDNGVAAGRVMGKVTVQRNANGDVERVWERQLPDQTEEFQNTLDLMQQYAENLPVFDSVPEPEHSDDDLLTTYFISDLHLGMLAWARETGSPWDVNIAAEAFTNAIDRMSSNQRSSKCLLMLLGDFVHWDGATAVTPQHGNLLDADIRYPKLQEMALLVVENAVLKLLKRHQFVYLGYPEGNHDIASSSWIRVAMDRIFSKNERVIVDTTPFPYTAMQHGSIMLGFHHGHRKKDRELSAVFAAEPRYRSMWGSSTHTYIHTGHSHKSQMLISEQGGAIVERHPTLAARDAYATSIGGVSVRRTCAITYHSKYGEVERVTVLPEYSRKIENERIGP